VELAEAFMVGVEVIVNPTVGLTEAASWPTARFTPQTWGSVRVAEYTHVGFSLTPLIATVAPQAKASLKVRLHVGLTGASGPYSIWVY
jgi:hypothetical protein